MHVQLGLETAEHELPYVIVLHPDPERIHNSVRGKHIYCIFVAHVELTEGSRGEHSLLYLPDNIRIKTKGGVGVL